MSLAQATPPGPHLGRVQPVLKVLSAADVRQHQLVESVFTCQGEQGSTHSNTQQQEEAREVTNPHLEGLRGRDSRGRVQPVQPTIGPADSRCKQADRKCVRQTRKCLPQ